MLRRRPYETPFAWSGLPLPRMMVGEGLEHRHRIGLSPRWRTREIVLCTILLPWIAGLFVMLLALAAVCCLASMPIPRARRRVFGDFVALRHPVHVELDRFPVFAGETVSVTVRQPSRPARVELAARLVCCEEVTYEQGTTTERATERVFEEDVAFEDRSFDSRSSGDGRTPIARTGRVEVPADAMHSFASANNRLIWSIEVERTFPGCAAVTRDHPFIVAPASLADGTPGPGTRVGEDRHERPFVGTVPRRLAS